MNRIRRIAVRALLMLLLAPLPATAASHQADPLLFHVHGLSFSSDGKALIVPSHTGLAVYRDGKWAEEAGITRDFTGFAVTEGAMYASGHPTTDARRAAYFGLLKSTDAGKTWRSVALAGEADFHVLAAGFRSLAIYVVSPLANSQMPRPGLHVTHDEGKTWRRAAARGLFGELYGLAAHPAEAATVAAATDNGLYLSRDAGERFRRLHRSQPVTAATFETDGSRILYVHALSNHAVSITLDGKSRRAIRLPQLAGDYVTYVAQSPADERSVAFATRRRSVFVSGNGGSTWHQIANEGDLP